MHCSQHSSLGSYLLQGLLTLGLAIVPAVVIVAVAFRFLRKSVLWNRLILSHSETKEMGYVALEST